MRPTLPALIVAALTALPAAALGHRHHAASPAAGGPAGQPADASTPPAYDYGTSSVAPPTGATATAATTTMAGAPTTSTATGGKKAKHSQTDPLAGIPDYSGGAQKGKNKAQTLPAY